MPNNAKTHDHIIMLTGQSINWPKNQMGENNIIERKMFSFLFFYENLNLWVIFSYIFIKFRSSEKLRLQRYF